MNTTFEMNARALLMGAQAPCAPMVVRRSGGVSVCEAEAFHRAAWSWEPALYALCALADGVGEAQRGWILYNVLSKSRVGLGPEQRLTLERVSEALMAILPADEVLTVFLGLRHARANHKHTTRAIVSWVLNHPQLEDMAVRRRSSVVDAIEHALGRDVARACAFAMSGAGNVDGAYVRRHLGRFALDAARLEAVIPYLWKHGESKPISRGDYKKSHTPALHGEQGEARPKTVTSTNRGDISATLVHLYQGGPNAALEAGLEAFVAAAAAKMPTFGGRLAVVLDLSGSTRGYGDREYCTVSQSVALEAVLSRCCSDIHVVRVGGGSGSVPAPCGATDLAMGLLDALDVDPDVVALVTDGYENTLHGDLADVVEALPGAGVDVPVVLCHSLFTAQDNLSYRQPAPALEAMSFWHEDDFRGLAFQLFTMARGRVGDAFLREVLALRLVEQTREVTRWIESAR